MYSVLFYFLNAKSILNAFPPDLISYVSVHWGSLKQDWALNFYRSAYMGF